MDFKWKTEAPLTGIEQGTDVIRLVFVRATLVTNHFLKTGTLPCVSGIMGNQDWRSREGKRRILREDDFAT